MSKSLPDHPLFSALLARASLLANVKKLQDDINRHEQHAINALYEVLPNDGTRLFIDKQGVIQDLARTGRHLGVLRLGSNDVPPSEAQLKRIIAAVETAWKGVVEVMTYETTLGTFIVTFKAKEA